MMQLSYADVARLTGGTLYNSHRASQQLVGVSIDSRSLEAGMMFCAIAGEQHDGHDFIRAAVDRGASGLMVSHRYPELTQLSGDLPVIAVSDTHRGLIKLSCAYRDRVNPVRIGLTGSNGKTTTKEMAYALAHSVDPTTYRSAGNWNNLYGIPLAWCAMPNGTTTAIMEMGISRPGEMAQLAPLVKPGIAAVLNIGPAHLEHLGSLENIAREKLQLISASEQPQLWLNADDDLLIRIATESRLEFKTFGLSPAANITPDQIVSAGFATTVTIRGQVFNLPMVGEHQVRNLLAAYALVTSAGLSLDTIATESISFSTTSLRGERIAVNGMTFVVDCYNANPASMRSGLTTFANSPTTGRRVAIVGDMLELGNRAEQFHREIGQLIAGLEIDVVIVVGSLGATIADEAEASGFAVDSIYRFASSSELNGSISQLLQAQDTVYLKASRGVGLETVIPISQREREEVA